MQVITLTVVTIPWFMPGQSMQGWNFPSNIRGSMRRTGIPPAAGKWKSSSSFALAESGYLTLKFSTDDQRQEILCCLATSNRLPYAVKIQKLTYMQSLSPHSFPLKWCRGNKWCDDERRWVGEVVRDVQCSNYSQWCCYHPNRMPWHMPEI